MPNVAMKLKAGVDLVSTSLLNETGYGLSNLIRFFNGLAQKLGGWTRISNDHLVGTCRGLHAFMDLSLNGYIAAGSEQALQLWKDDNLIYDITPIATTVNLAAPFDTVAGSSVVTVNSAAHGRAVDDWIYVATATYVDGLVLQGRYQVATVPNVNQYTIDAGANAVVGVIGGGTTIAVTSNAASSLVNVTLGAHVFAAGDPILIYVPTVVSTLTLSGSYTMLDPFQFDATAVAAANAGPVSENGGNVQILYLLASQIDPTSPYVYGSGPYGAGAYGLGQDFSEQLNLRLWSLANWGQILLASPLNAALYDWTPPIAYNNRAALVANAPAYNTALFVAMPQQQVVSAGTDGGGFLDPLLVKFSDVGDYSSATAWTPLVTNQAGSFRLTSGSRIVGAYQGAVQGYIWTDIDLWIMRYIQPPFIYSFNKVGNAPGLIAERAVGEVRGAVIWCSHNGIFAYTGESVVPVPCTVWDFFFDSYDPVYSPEIHVGVTADFNEWTMWFPTLGSDGVITSYIKYNASENVWDCGSMNRTAFIDRSDAAPPVGAEGADGLLQAHETSYDADGAAMDSWVETGWMRISEGSYFTQIDRLIPDQVLNEGATTYVIVTVQDYPNDPNPRTYGPFTMTEATRFVILRCRGRLIKMRFGSDVVGTFWRLGLPTYLGSPAGRR